MDKDLVPTREEQREVGIKPVLTTKEIKLIQNLQDTNTYPTILSAALDAGYTEETARKAIYSHLGKIRFKRGQELIASKQRDRARGFLELGRDILLEQLQAGNLNEREKTALGLELYKLGQRDRETVGDADPDGIQAMSSSLDRVRLLQAQCILAGIDAAQRFRRPLLERWARRLRRQVKELEELLS